MTAAIIRSRGQAAIFAGIILALVVPLFRLGALVPTGYADAIAQSAAIKDYSPLLSWAGGHLSLVVVTALLQALPFVVIVALPYTLRRVVFGADGRVAQAIGLAGITVNALFALIDLITLVAFARQFVPHTSFIGVRFRDTAITEALISNVLGGILLTVWLVILSLPMARIDGLERWVGFAGVLGAALFGAGALLTLYNPSQPVGSVVGSAQGWFGAWLILVGVLLIRRAPALGDEAAEPAEAPSEPITTTAR